SIWPRSSWPRRFSGSSSSGSSSGRRRAPIDRADPHVDKTAGSSVVMGILREEPKMTRRSRLLIVAVMLTWPLVAAGQQPPAPPRAVDWVAIYPDDGLVVALAYDGTNIHSRLGIGSSR